MPELKVAFGLTTLGISSQLGLLHDRHPDAEAQRRDDGVDSLLAYRDHAVPGDVA